LDKRLIMYKKVEFNRRDFVIRLVIIFCIGGIYSPIDCTSRQQLAVIIPFRTREPQLKVLLRHLHPFLQRQKRAYQVFVVEQVLSAN